MYTMWWCLPLWEWCGGGACGCWITTGWPTCSCTTVYVATSCSRTGRRSSRPPADPRTARLLGHRNLARRHGVHTTCHNSHYTWNITWHHILNCFHHSSQIIIITKHGRNKSWGGGGNPLLPLTLRFWESPLKTRYTLINIAFEQKNFKVYHISLNIECNQCSTFKGI